MAAAKEAVSRHTHSRHGQGHVGKQILIISQGYELDTFSNKIEDRLILETFRFFYTSQDDPFHHFHRTIERRIALQSEKPT